MIKIHLEDLVANAIIEIERRTKRTYVTGRELNNYGRAVLFDLKAKNIRAKLEISKDLFKNTYQDYFSVYGDGYQLNPEKSTEDVVNHFRKHTSYDVLLSLVDDRIIDKSFNLYPPKQKYMTFNRKKDRIS